MGDIVSIGRRAGSGIHEARASEVRMAVATRTPLSDEELPLFAAAICDAFGLDVVRMGWFEGDGFYVDATGGLLLPGEGLLGIRREFEAALVVMLGPGEILHSAISLSGVEIEFIPGGIEAAEREAREEEAGGGADVLDLAAWRPRDGDPGH